MVNGSFLAVGLLTPGLLRIEQSGFVISSRDFMDLLP